MCYSVIIPMTFDCLANKDSWHSMARYFSVRGVRVFLAVNGPSGVFDHGDAIFDECQNIFILDGGEEPNPYTARNAAMKDITQHYGSSDYEKGFFLTDADCVPCIGLHEAISKNCTEDTLSAGRVTTLVPDINTHHFKGMRGLEVYDGFKEPYEAYGASMFIGIAVWNTLGPMKEDSVSGGDFDYTYRWLDMGFAVQAEPKMHVRKVVYGMDLLGIMRKQITRGYSRSIKASDDVAQMISDAGDSLWEVASRLRSDITLFSDYHTFLDNIFSSFFLLGRIARRLDSSEPLNDHRNTNEEQCSSTFEPPGQPASYTQ